MEVTREEQNQLLSEFQPRIADAVVKFHARIHYRSSDKPELMQVAYLAFLNLVRKAKDRETLRKTYFRAITSSLFYFYEDEGPVHIRHAQYYKVIKTLEYVSYEELPETICAAPDQTVRLAPALRSFMERLTPEQREMVRLKLEGRHYWEIKERMGLTSHDCVFRQFKQMRAIFAEFLEDDGNRD